MLKTQSQGLQWSDTAVTLSITHLSLLNFCLVLLYAAFWNVFCSLKSKVIYPSFLPDSLITPRGAVTQLFHFTKWREKYCLCKRQISAEKSISRHVMLINSQEEMWPLIANKTLQSSSPFEKAPKVAAKHFLRSPVWDQPPSLNISSVTWENSLGVKMLQKVWSWGWIYLHKPVLN